MASITPIIATQDTPQSDGSAAWVDCSCETSALADGVDYFVAYYGNCGSSDTSGNAAMRLLFGATTIGEVYGEGRGLDQHWDSSELTGYAMVTGDGSSTLKFQMNSILSNDIVYAGAMQIVAVPLTALTLNSDYWYSGTNSDSLEQEAPSDWTTLRSQAFTLPDDGDYLVLMSAEMKSGDSNTMNSAWKLRFYVDSTEICPTDSADEGYLEEWEDDDDWCSGKVSELVNLSAGSRTFKIECDGRNDDSDFRRSRIWVFRKASFDQIVRTTDSTGESTDSSSYVDFDGLNTTYTPNQEEYVLIILHAIGRNSTFYTTIVQLYNDSDSTAHRVDAGEYNNGYGTGSGGDINLNASPIHCGQYSAAKNWKVQYRTDGGTTYIGRNKNDDGGVKSNLIFWGLTTAEAAETHESGPLGCNW